MLSASHVAAMFTNGSSAIVACTATTLWSIPLAGICASWSGDGLWPRPGMAPPFTALNSRELHATHSAVPSYSINMVEHTALGAWQRIT